METKFSLADRHAETMGMRYDHDTQMFYIRDGRYVIGLKRNNRTQQHRVSMCAVPGRVFEKLHDQTYTDLDTAVLVAHGLARRYGMEDQQGPPEPGQWSQIEQVPVK